MSMMNAALPAPEVGETVATYTKYEGAQKAVSQLIAENIPARDIAIVGRALRSVEKVTGKLGWARAAWQGALNGVMLGLLFAAFAVIWTPELAMPMIGGILLIGVGLGMAFRLLSYSIVRRKRDYASVTAVSADQYEVAVSPQHVAAARNLLGTTKPRTTVVQPPSDEPPKYGIRLSDQNPAPRAPADAEAATTDADASGSAATEAGTTEADTSGSDSMSGSAAEQNDGPATPADDGDAQSRD